MRIVRSLAIIGAVLALSTASLAAKTLVPHQAEYKVSFSIASGRLKTELRRSENGYVAHHVIKPSGLARMITRGRMDVTSEFDDQESGIRPLTFRSVDSIRDDPTIDLMFDWVNNEATGFVGDEAVVFPLDEIAHDNVSIQYQLMHDLLNGGPAERYTLFDVDGLTIADVTRVGSKEVKTKAGKFQAVGIQHQKEGSSRTTTLWCVEELGFLPVIIEQHRKGKLKFRGKLLTYRPTAE